MVDQQSFRISLSERQRTMPAAWVDGWRNQLEEFIETHEFFAEQNLDLQGDTWLIWNGRRSGGSVVRSATSRRPWLRVHRDETESDVEVTLLDDNPSSRAFFDTLRGFMSDFEENA